jgi:predicted PurR-regulated permease PerM
VIAVVLAVAAVLAMAWATRAIIVWLLTAGFLAFSIDPLVQLLRRKARVGNGAAIALATLVIALVLFAIGLIIFPAVVDGANALLDAVPAYAERLEDSGFVQSLGAEDQVESAEDGTQQISNFFSGISSILGTIGALASGAFAGFVIFVLTIYFLVYGRDIRLAIARRLGGTRGERFLVTSKRIYDATRGYWYGKFLIAVIAGVSVYIPMVLLDIPFAAPLAVFVGITDLIPNIGATLGAIPVVGVALFEAWWKGLIIGRRHRHLPAARELRDHAEGVPEGDRPPPLPLLRGRALLRRALRYRRDASRPPDHGRRADHPAGAPKPLGRRADVGCAV